MGNRNPEIGRQKARVRSPGNPQNIGQRSKIPARNTEAGMRSRIPASFLKS
jgi:hypothetical protein